MSGNTNAVDRLPSRISNRTTEIFTLNDFPDPISGVIPLTDGVYVIADSFTLSEQLEVVSGTVEIISAGLGKVLTYTGAAPFIQATLPGNTLLLFDNMNIDLVNDNAILFDAAGLLVVMRDSVIQFLGDSGTIGNVSQSGLFSMRGCVFDGFADGMVINNVLRAVLSSCIFITNQTGTEAVITAGGTVPVLQADQMIFNAGAAEVLFHLVSPSTRALPNGIVIITRAVNENGSVFFDPTGFDETHPDVFVKLSPPQKSSRNVAGAYTNGETSGTTIVNGVFTDISFGVPVALTQTADTELWTLTDDTNGEFRYDGQITFYGAITLDVLLNVPVAAAQTFILKVVKDPGGGFVDLTDSIELRIDTMVIGAATGNGSITMPLVCEPGDSIKPQITRTNGMATPVVNHFSMYAAVTGE
jgi:hypothetical protein